MWAKFQSHRIIIHHSLNSFLRGSSLIHHIQYQILLLLYHVKQQHRTDKRLLLVLASSSRLQRQLFLLAILRRLLNVLREAVSDLIGHQVVEQAEILTLLLAQVCFDKIQKFGYALRSALLIEFEILRLLRHDSVVIILSA
jgi:hypothetical protein